MGLAIEVGMIEQMRKLDEEGLQHYQQCFAVVNGLLAAQGLAEHAEPDQVDSDSRAECVGFPYSFIHYLRRAFVHRRADPAWMATPVPDSEDPTEDDLVRDELEDGMSSHLVCHSDAEGFYVPVDFSDLIMGRELPGGILGSSQQLMRELVLVAPALNIRLEDGKLSDAEAARINALAASDEGLYREYCAWIALFEAARISIAQRTAIVFC